MSVQYLPAPELMGAVAVTAATYAPNLDLNTPARLVMDAATGALIVTSAAGGNAQEVQGNVADGTLNANPNPILIAGTYNDGDVHLKAASIDSNGNLQVGIAGTPSVSLTRPATTQYRTRTATNTDTTVSASPGGLYSINVINLLATAIYLKLFDAASVTPGTTIQNYTIPIPASGTFMARGADLPYRFATAIHFLVTTSAADTGAQAAPGTLPIIELETGA